MIVAVLVSETTSGLLPITRMIKAGAVFDIIGAVLIVGGVTVMAQAIGLA